MTNGYGHTQSNGGTYISGNNLDELPVKDPIDPYGYAPNSYNNGSGDYAHAIPSKIFHFYLTVLAPNITNGFNGLQQYLEELSQLTAQKCPMEDQARFLKDILFVVQTSAQVSLLVFRSQLHFRTSSRFIIPTIVTRYLPPTFYFVNLVFSTFVTDFITALNESIEKS